MSKKTLLFILFLSLALYGMDSPTGGRWRGDKSVEIIIKVEPKTIIMPEGVYNPRLSEVEIRSKDLRDLNNKFNLISIEKMYVRKGLGEDPETADLENTFLLKFSALIPVEEIIEEYEDVDEVIYAEENKVVEIY